MWYDKYHDGDGDYWSTEGDNNDKFFKWYDAYKKRKAQKAKIKEEFLPLSWQPSKLWDWCVFENGQGDAENCGHKYGLILYPVTEYKNILTKQNYK